MLALEISHHAEQRLRQRGIPQAQLKLVLQCGTQVDEGGYFFSDADVDAAIAERKREIQSLEKVRGCKIVLDGDTVVTAYRPDRRKRKRMLRRIKTGVE